jgi:hypothetical protein
MKINSLNVEHHLIFDTEKFKASHVISQCGWFEIENSFLDFDKSGKLSNCTAAPLDDPHKPQINISINVFKRILE